MRSFLLLATCLATSSLLCAVEKSKPIYDSDVLAWPEYLQAKKSGLVLTKNPNRGSDMLKDELPNQTTRKAVEVKIAAILKRMDFPVPATYDWQVSGPSWYVRAMGNDGTGVFCGVDRKKREIHWFSLARDEPFTANRSEISPKVVLKFARDTYAKVFGEPLVAESHVLGDQASLTRFYNKRIVWGVELEGVAIGQGSFKIERKDKSPNRLMCERAPTKAEVEELKKYLSKHPRKFTERQAMAIVLKAWKDLGEPPQSVIDEKYNLSCRKTKAVREYGYGKGLRTGEIYWVSTQAKRPHDHLYVYEVRIQNGLFQIAAEVDWETGQILWMHQGSLAW